MRTRNSLVWKPEGNRTIGRPMQRWQGLRTTKRSTALLEKLTGPQLVKNFPAFYVTRKFIIEFTTARHVSLFWARIIQFTFWWSILILSSPSKRALPFRFPHQNHVHTSPPFMRVTCPAHLIPIRIQRIIKEYNVKVAWSGMIWLWIGTSGVFLWIRNVPSGYHKMHSVS
jgi:hypothetical protein